MHIHCHWIQQAPFNTVQHLVSPCFRRLLHREGVMNFSNSSLDMLRASDRFCCHPLKLCCPPLENEGARDRQSCDATSNRSSHPASFVCLPVQLGLQCNNSKCMPGFSFVLCKKADASMVIRETLPSARHVPADLGAFVQHKEDVDVHGDKHQWREDHVSLRC